ncbi:MAG TPA: carboxypeptidase-like regulatory domain-containing protein, partial [Pyrinomonadaceae bacterium]|nr:carboxypeptidase-like regulatory domain-containing protein [Pyrinomonadaceae bacterium]
MNLRASRSDYFAFHNSDHFNSERFNARFDSKRRRLRRRFLRAALFLLACFLSCAAPARAQDLDDATISGTVSDQNGAVVPGATVTATLAATGAARTVVTDGEGRFRLVELPPGAYTVRAMRAGFADAERMGLETVAGQSVRLDFTLRPAGVVAEQVVVSGTSTPLVDATRTVTGGTITREELERLPLPARSPLDFVFTLPGVTEEPLSVRDAAEDRDAGVRAGAQRAATTPEEAGTFALAGGAAYSNNITIDGLDNNDD